MANLLRNDCIVIIVTQDAYYLVLTIYSNRQCGTEYFEKLKKERERTSTEFYLNERRK